MRKENFSKKWNLSGFILFSKEKRNVTFIKSINIVPIIISDIKSKSIGYQSSWNDLKTLVRNSFTPSIISIDSPKAHCSKIHLHLIE